MEGYGGHFRDFHHFGRCLRTERRTAQTRGVPPAETPQRAKSRSRNVPATGAPPRSSFREALQGDHPCPSVIHDPDSIFSAKFAKVVTDLGVRVLRTTADTANSIEHPQKNWSIS